MTKGFPVLLVASALSLALHTAVAAEVAAPSLPPVVQRHVSFEADVMPILSRSCFDCHGERKQKSDFRLDAKAHAMRGGSTGVAIVPGKSAQSPLIQYVAGLVEDM